MGAKFLTTAQVRVRYGGVSRMWIFRKQKTDGFPMHATRFGGQRRHWLLSDLEEWEARMVGAGAGIKPVTSG
jgi:predicted DNA-binding transcriptional regulator AlpA